MKTLVVWLAIAIFCVWIFPLPQWRDQMTWHKNKEVFPQDLEIGNDKNIGRSHPCFIVAEVGQNHQGDIEIAKQLIIAAKESGADCVKFQKTCITEKFNGKALSRPYVSDNSWGSTYGEHKQHLEFSLEQFKELQRYAQQAGILFTASAMDVASVDVLDSMDVPFIKIGSGDANNFPMLEYAASKGRPLIVSTGMQEMSTVRKIYSTLQTAKARFCLLHCVSSYPTPPEHVNLNVLNEFREAFPDVHVGYSGHELGTAISVAAVAMGARVLERHLTLNNGWKGSDHICSLTPNTFRSLVDQIRLVEQAFGSTVKSFQPSEQPCYDKLGKTLVASRDLERGHVIELQDLKVKVAEPKGWPAEKIYKIIGKTLNKSIPNDDSIMLNDVC